MTRFSGQGERILKAWRFWLPLLLLLGGTAALWPLRHRLTAETIAARSPKQAVLAAGLLLLLYGVKSLSIGIPLSALEAAGGLLFPFPAAAAVNLTGVAIAQLLPWLLGRRQRGGLAAVTARYPRLEALMPSGDSHPGRTVFLLRLGGVSPGDLVSLYLGAAGVPLRSYLTGGLLGSFPRVISATLLGSALWHIGGRRFWLSVGTGAALTAVSLCLWKFWRGLPAC